MFKNRAENKIGRLDRPLFAILKTFKQVVTSLVLIYFGRPQLGNTIKENLIIFQTTHLEICSFLIFCK